jgi:hypothetical protein
MDGVFCQFFFPHSYLNLLANSSIGCGTAELAEAVGAMPVVKRPRGSILGLIMQACTAGLICFSCDRRAAMARLAAVAAANYQS